MYRPRAILTLVALAAVRAGAQAAPVSRAAAVEAALARGPRLALAAADTSVARGLLLSARAFPNPDLTASYTEDTPQYHVGFDLPVDYPWLRSTRVRAAEATRTSALHRFTLERAAAALDADTLYTLALAGRARTDISARNARAADSLYRIVVARRDAGDVSTLDVEVASLYSGEQANAAAADSLDFLTTVLSLQAVMGLPTDSVRIALADSLTPPAAGATTAPVGTPLGIASAEAAVEAADLLARLERRNVWAPPGLSLGFDTRDPGGHENKLLPAIGITLPLPLLNRNSGPIALADAERARARAELALAQAE
ncbi:MAG TPA: TolC family protein, partial [Gemmatimonadaceae bacterium]|nr:TolC family protein [Gemmatimonadaceae bacterium]